MNQSFTADQLIKLCSPYERQEYENVHGDIRVRLESAYNDIESGTFTFTISQSTNHYYVESLIELLVLRKLNENIKGLYKDVQANRRIIINQVKILLEENTPMHILKTDIEAFYESVNRQRILDKFRADAILSYHSIALINKLFANTLLPLDGLPRGINVSATLSEIYLRKFDKWIKRQPGIYYYARFVDDIIIFANSKLAVENVNRGIGVQLRQLGLKKKESKTQIFKEEIKVKKPLEYLGYQFTTTIIKRQKTVEISIANKKVKKIKSRIALSFASFINQGDFQLLEKRIKFLTGNYSIRSSNNSTDLKAGIYYNYYQVNQHKVFLELNLYYRKMLFSKNASFGVRLQRLLSQAEKNILCKYSFKHGFNCKVYYPFTWQEINQIKSCWT